MGIWKASCSVRISAESKVALEEFAKREQRTFGNLCGILLEWGAAQLRKAWVDGAAHASKGSDS